MCLVTTGVTQGNKRVVILVGKGEYSIVTVDIVLRRCLLVVKIEVSSLIEWF